MCNNQKREWTKAETLQKLIQLQNQYDAVVAQNRSLQEELSYIKRELKENFVLVTCYESNLHNALAYKGKLLEQWRKEHNNYCKALQKILELNSDCADCKEDCTFCSSGTNKETYEIAKTILLSEVEI